jgi:hypothetical protein
LGNASFADEASGEAWRGSGRLLESVAAGCYAVAKKESFPFTNQSKLSLAGNLETFINTLILLGKSFVSYGGLAGTRTLDQCLKRALLYQLSYQPTEVCGIEPTRKHRDKIKRAAKTNQRCLLTQDFSTSKSA